MAASKPKRAAAGRKKPAADAALQKQIEQETEDPFDRAGRVAAETSSDGRFSSYEVAPKNDPRDGDLILQYRGAPGSG